MMLVVYCFQKNIKTILYFLFKQKSSKQSVARSRLSSTNIDIAEEERGMDGLFVPTGAVELVCLI